MFNPIFEKILGHVGHKIVAVTYGPDEAVADACIECEDCSEVIISGADFDQEEVPTK